MAKRNFNPKSKGKDTKSKGETGIGKKPGRKHIVMGRKQASVKDPQRFEQCGEIHVLEAKVYAGTATVEEALAFVIQDYELKYLELQELDKRLAKGVISQMQKEDMVWLNDWLSENLERYHGARVKLQELEAVE